MKRKNNNFIYNIELYPKRLKIFHEFEQYSAYWLDF